MLKLRFVFLLRHETTCVLVRDCNLNTGMLRRVTGKIIFVIMCLMFLEVKSILKFPDSKNHNYGRRVVLLSSLAFINVISQFLSSQTG